MLSKYWIAVVLDNRSKPLSVSFIPESCHSTAASPSDTRYEASDRLVQPSNPLGRKPRDLAVPGTRGPGLFTIMREGSSVIDCVVVGVAGVDVVIARKERLYVSYYFLCLLSVQVASHGSTALAPDVAQQ